MIVNSSKTIVLKLKKIIKERYKQQKIFANRFNISEHTVSYWLQGKHSPNVDILIDIANDCNLPVSYFFTEDDFIDSHDVINEDIFNIVFELAYNLALERDLEINGSYFLGCYDLIIEELNKSEFYNIDNTKEKKEDLDKEIITIFHKIIPFIIKFVKKR